MKLESEYWRLTAVPYAHNQDATLMIKTSVYLVKLGESLFLNQVAIKKGATAMTLDSLFIPFDIGRCDDAHLPIC